MSVTITKETSTYIKWRDSGAGFIVLEKYGDTWHVELIRVAPPRQGIGSRLLKTARERFRGESMTVCAVEEGVPFFAKHGAVNGVLPSLV